MAWLILIGFLLFTTIVYVYLQKLVIKLPHKIWHFVPIIFLGVLTVYGYLRSNRVIVYYSDCDNDWTNGVIEFVTGIHGFLTSLITMVIIYLQQRKRPASPAEKVRKVFAVTVSVFMIAFTVFNVYSIVSYDYSQNTVDYQSQKLMTIGEYMFDKLHEGDFDTNTSFRKKELSEYIDRNKNSDVYSAVRYSELISVGFLDEHTVKITVKVLFHSISGYLITDGQKNYKNGFYKIPGSGYDGGGIYIHRESENIYSWSAGQ